jgi:predicted MFS family arabinose efflux permease
LILFVLALCGFASAMSGRILDPVMTSIAGDFGAPITIVASLSSAYALPFALSQPVLGPLGDLFPKVLIIKIAIALLAVFLFLGAVAPTLSTLFGARILAGAGSAGIIPAGFAIIGDRVALGSRQLAISRFVAASLTGQLFGASAAGVLSDFVGWRGVLGVSALITFAIAAGAFAFLPGSQPPRHEVSRSGGAIANYRSVLHNPLSLVCFSVVLVEGAAIYGVFPFIADHLRTQSNAGSREAGIVIAGLAVGGLAYASTVPLLLRFFARRTLMVSGGAVAAAGLASLGFGADWTIEAAFMATVGFGFFMLHNSVQTEVSELSSTARASAFSLHAFSFYLGQAVGPLLYGAGIMHLGMSLSLDVAAIGIFLIGLFAYRMFRQAK